MCRYVLLALCDSRRDFQISGFKERSIFEIQTKGIQTNNQGAEMSAIQFDHLPYLCLKRIFGFLDPPDLVRCRRVNRQFKFFADATGAYKLFCAVRKDYFRLESELDRLKSELSWFDGFDSLKKRRRFPILYSECFVGIPKCEEELERVKRIKSLFLNI